MIPQAVEAYGRIWGCAVDLTGKVAFVTGGSGDIGGAIAKALAASGVNVAVSYVGDAGRADAAVDAVQRLGRQSHAVQLDQRDPKSIDGCVGSVLGHFGRVDILVNNAGWNIGIPFGELDALTPEIWDRVLETNLRGPFLLTRALASELRRHKAGRVINIASLAGIAPGGSSIAYAASKQH
jgi:3-oxoacyl-[acyl-carrier protein] reductase